MPALRKTKSMSLGRFVSYAIIAFFLVFYMVPILWLFISSTRDDVTLLTANPMAYGSWSNLKDSWNELANFNNFQILQWAKNSLIYTVGGVSVSLIACIPAGYSLALGDFPGRKAILVLTLIAVITPSTAVALPIFLGMKLVGLNNTYLSLILATGFFPFGVYLSYIYFTTSLPRAILDSARVDGCSRFGQFVFIALPLAKPAIALVAFFSFLSNWSNYFLAFVLLGDDDLYNLPVGLAALVSGSGALTNVTVTTLQIRKPEVILAAILVILPVLLVFLVAQRLVRAGLLSGAEKG